MPYYLCAACGLTSYSAAAYSTARGCPNCSVALPDDAKLDLTPGIGRRTTHVVRARPEAAPEARRALVGLALPEVTRDKLALLVTELVSNAVRHAGLAIFEPVDVEVTYPDGHVRLAVHDGGRGFVPDTLERRDPLTPSGQGLVIVAALSDAWGVERNEDGCTVWCEVAVDEEPAAAPEREVTAGYMPEQADWVRPLPFPRLA
jgi:anti-sigma regulatory factor (Ser/Thr protein kinase)